MSSYATIDEIKASSRNIPAIQNGTDEEILQWAGEAYTWVNQHCGMNFTFEQQGSRDVAFTSHPRVYLPGVLSGSTTMLQSGYSVSSSQVDMSRDMEHTPGDFSFRYTARNYVGSNSNVRAITLSITGDWGFAPSREYLLVAAANDLKSRFNQHLASTSSHVTADVTNPVITASATSLASSITLLNSLAGKLTPHATNLTSHLGSSTLIFTPATDELSAVALAIRLKASFNAHLGSMVQHLGIDRLASLLSVTNPVMPGEIKLAFTKILQRVAIRDNAEDLRYHNSGFTSESFSDGYSYSLADPGLRSPITAYEQALLSEYVNDGQVAY